MKVARKFESKLKCYFFLKGFLNSPCGTQNNVPFSTQDVVVTSWNIQICYLTWQKRFCKCD